MFPAGRIITIQKTYIQRAKIHLQLFVLKKKERRVKKINFKNIKTKRGTKKKPH